MLKERIALLCPNCRVFIAVDLAKYFIMDLLRYAPYEIKRWLLSPHSNEEARTATITGINHWFHGKTVAITGTLVKSNLCSGLELSLLSHVYMSTVEGSCYKSMFYSLLQLKKCKIRLFFMTFKVIHNICYVSRGFMGSLHVQHSCKLWHIHKCYFNITVTDTGISF